uniref:Uncharacterized protein n=1 Tax=viral metagenome TaxID=1070528 RepID=A0A6C0BN03_9ZZZZ
MNQLYVNHQRSVRMSEVMQDIKDQASKLSREYKINLDTTMEYSYALGDENYIIGYGYLWVKDDRLYNAILGKNFDGTDRIRVFEESKYPEYERKERMFMEIMDGFWKDIDNPGYVDWSELQKREDEIIESYQPKVKTEVLPPLIDFSKQLKENPEFYVTPAHLREFRGGMRHVLTASGVDPWVTPTIVLNAFNKYLPNDKIQIRVEIRNGVLTVTFPDYQPNHEFYNLSRFILNMRLKCCFFKNMKDEIVRLKSIETKTKPKYSDKVCEVMMKHAYYRQTK